MSLGYDPNFLSHVHLPLPQLTSAQLLQTAHLLSNAAAYELKYTHFSIVMNKLRKFAFFTATNIDGSQWKAEMKERIKFTKEKDLLPEHQTGDELYSFYKSKTNNDFDQGHITKFQDPQWGSKTIATTAASDTMRFTNCVPQHCTLNRGAWKSLEDYIVKQFTTDTGADGNKISVFAGPVLSANDPFYIDKINGQSLQIPCMFWKVIVFRNKKDKLSAVAFMMSQLTILRKYNFVVAKAEETLAAKSAKQVDTKEFFADYASAEPYQVRVDFVEKLTGLKFGLGKLNQPFKKKEPTEIIYKRIEVPPADKAILQNASTLKKIELVKVPLSFKFEGISL
jgi:endonuclease G, mitochondrial